nr:hypothetical protein [Tanacetum cinerariifolium]
MYVVLCDSASLLILGNMITFGAKALGATAPVTAAGLTVAVVGAAVAGGTAAEKGMGKYVPAATDELGHLGRFIVYVENTRIVVTGAGYEAKVLEHMRNYAQNEPKVKMMMKLSQENQFREPFDDCIISPSNTKMKFRHVRETITITSTQNTNGIVQLEEVEEKPVKIIHGPVGIVQLAKIRKQPRSVNNQIFTEKNVVKVFHKDFVPGNGSGVSGSGMLMEEEEIVKLVEEEEMTDLELHVCGNVIDQEDLYKFYEEALDLVLEEAMELRAHEEWLEKCRQQKEEDAEHERHLLGFHGTI